MIVVRKLIWDGWNVAHIARHEVVPEEVEQVCAGKHMVFDGNKGRFIVIGVTEEKRILAVVLGPAPEAGVYYPITARPADRRERRLYWNEKGGGGADDQAA